MEELASGVAVLRVSIANVYFLGEPGRPWLLVDTGVPWSALKIQQAAEERFGVGAKPEGILLTHGHPDHSGSAFDLAVAWEVPIYVHPLEMPYLTGKAAYPPADPTVGGALAFLGRLFPPVVKDLRPRLLPLAPDSAVPALPDWEWLPTPGHAPGHVSLYRKADRTLIAGDAFTTVNMDSVTALLAMRQEISRPPAPATCDWGAARASVQQLAALTPNAIGCGHGAPMNGRDTAARLAAFAAHFPVPARGRYIGEPARTDADGIVSLPPPPPDPFPKQAAAGLAAAVVLGMTWAITRRRHDAH